MKIRPVGAKLFNVERQTDRHTDVMKLTVSFAILVNTPKRQTVKPNG